MDPLTTIIVNTTAVEVVKRLLKIILDQPGGLPRPEPVALRCHGGQLLCADQNKGGLVLANGSQCRDWEVFMLRHLGGGKVNLLACDGRYVSADRNRGGLLVADRTSPWGVVALSWELFTIEHRQPCGAAQH